jgi:hypothetical protein
MPGPEPDPRLLIRVAIMDAIDAMIRERAARKGGLSPDEVEAFVAERNRVARCLGRPAFDAVELLVGGTDD